MAKRHTHRGIKPERGQDVAGVVIRLAYMGPDALGVELGHDIRRGQGVEREGHKPLAVGVVGAAQDRDTRQIGQSGEVPRAEPVSRVPISQFPAGPFASVSIGSAVRRSDAQAMP